MPRVLRNRVRVSYDELEEPSFDEYLFCSSCGDYVYEYCAIHGPLLVIPDDEVPSPTGFPPFVPRAALTVPRLFLHLAPSTIPGAGIGVFSTLTLPRGVRFGPYRGMKTKEASSPYCWQIFDRSHAPAHVLDARDADKSNWMRYVNCSRHAREQNLLAYQYYGQLYYRTIRIIPRFTELLVFYGSESARELAVDVRRYNLPAYFETLVKCEPSTEESDKLSSIKEVKRDILTVDVKENALLNPVPENTPIFNNESEVINLKSTKPDSNESENKAQHKKYVCDNCGQTFYEKDNLITHIAAHSSHKDVTINNNTLQKRLCSICDRKFRTKTALINHLVSLHHSKIEYKACTQCDFKTEKNKYLKEHMKRHDHRFKCDLCKYEAGLHRDLIGHKKCHSTDQSSCMTCGLKLANKRTLNIHLLMHTENRPYQCTVCGIAFKENKNLKRHLIIHTMREKPFKCLICNKCFYNRHSLKRHAKLHQ